MIDDDIREAIKKFDHDIRPPRQEFDMAIGTPVDYNGGKFGIVIGVVKTPDDVFPEKVAVYGTGEKKVEMAGEYKRITSKKDLDNLKDESWKQFPMVPLLISMTNPKRNGFVRMRMVNK